MLTEKKLAILPESRQLEARWHWENRDELSLKMSGYERVGYFMLIGELANALLDLKDTRGILKRAMEANYRWCIECYLPPGEHFDDCKLKKILEDGTSETDEVE